MGISCRSQFCPELKKLLKARDDNCKKHTLRHHKRGKPNAEQHTEFRFRNTTTNSPSHWPGAKKEGCLWDASLEVNHHHEMPFPGGKTANPICSKKALSTQIHIGHSSW